MGVPTGSPCTSSSPCTSIDLRRPHLTLPNRARDGRSRVYGNCLCVHSPQQVCVAVIYTDVRGEGGRNAYGQCGNRTSSALSDKCRSTCGSGCGNEPTRRGGSDGKDTGGDHRPKHQSLPPHRRGSMGYRGNGMGGIYIAEAWGVSILQPLIGSLVECCSVVTCVLASGLLYHSIEISYKIIHYCRAQGHGEAPSR